MVHIRDFTICQLHFFKKIDTVNQVFLFTLSTHPSLAVEPFVPTKIYWEAWYLKPVSLELFPGYTVLFHPVLLPNLEGPRTSWPCCWCLRCPMGRSLASCVTLNVQRVPDWVRIYGYSGFLEYIWLVDIEVSVSQIPWSLPLVQERNSGETGHFQDF